ncbi:hypothetical protein [Lentilactobacillus parafarraginis]|nr:hypothetical protein [Lentilactobacillus parafarraginis]
MKNNYYIKMKDSLVFGSIAAMFLLLTGFTTMVFADTDDPNSCEWGTLSV